MLDLERFRNRTTKNVLKLIFKCEVIGFYDLINSGNKHKIINSIAKLNNANIIIFEIDIDGNFFVKFSTNHKDVNLYVNLIKIYRNDDILMRLANRFNINESFRNLLNKTFLLECSA